MCKAFPGQPPFDAAWFGVLDDPSHPIAELRLEWILFNQHTDRMEAQEDHNASLDFAASFANPAAWRAYKEALRAQQGLPPGEHAGGGTIGPPELVIDDSHYWKLFRLAEANELRPEHLTLPSDALDAISQGKEDYEVWHGKVESAAATQDVPIPIADDEP